MIEYASYEVTEVKPCLACGETGEHGPFCLAVALAEARSRILELQAVIANLKRGVAQGKRRRAG